MTLLFSFEETPQSRQSDAESYLLIYKAVGELDDATVYTYAINATPSVVYRPTGTMYRQDIRVTPDGWSQYVVEVNYSLLSATPFNVGTFAFSFDTTGATINIKAAKEHIASFPDSGPHGGAIGVKDDGEVEGADIIVPALKLTYTFKHPQGIVTEAYARLLSSVTGMTNSAAFRGFQAGELLFAGGRGSDGTNAEADVGYEFIGSANASGLTIGDISSIVKGGHHYAWVEFKDEVVSNKPARKPKRVNIERVYDSFDFPSVLGWN